MTSVMSRALRTSSDDQPSTSRSGSRRLRRGQRVDRRRDHARASRRRAAAPPAAREAAPTRRRDSARRPRGGNGRDRPRPPGCSPGLLSAENGRTRPSRCARVFAVLTRIRKTHVFSDERPSKRSSAAEHAQPGLLHDLLGDRARGDEDLRDAKQRRMPLAHEPGERLLVARAQRGDELGIAAAPPSERTYVSRTPVPGSNRCASPARGRSATRAPRSGATFVSTRATSLPAPPGRREHVRVGADLLDHLDLGRDPVGGELERLRTQPDHHFALRARAVRQRERRRRRGSPSRSLHAHRQRFMAGEPMKPATNMFAGRSYSTRGVSHCCSRPSPSTATRSPSVIASDWSCVT